MSKPDLGSMPLGELGPAIRKQTAAMDDGNFLTQIVMNTFAARFEKAAERIMELETRCDPSGDIQTIASLREQVAALQNLLEECDAR
jgi:hypothetical protein